MKYIHQGWYEGPARSLLVFGAVLLSSMIACGAHASAATFTVGTFADDASLTSCTAAASASCSLRGAIILANASSAADTIELAPGTYILSLTGSDSTPASYVAAHGDLDITGPLVINGHGAVIDANHIDRVFDMGRQSATYFSVALNDLDIKNGLPAGALATGGGINCHGVNLTLNRCILENNSTHQSGTADDPGGALAVSGVYGASPATASLKVADCSFVQNAGGNGGAIALTDVSAVVDRSTIDSNSSSGVLGGAIFFTGSATTAVLRNVTVSHNTASASSGGAMSGGFGGGATLVNCTFCGNSALGGQGQCLNAASTVPTFKATNSIFSCASGANFSPGVLAGAQFTSQGHNVFSDSSAPTTTGDFVSVNPLTVFGSSTGTLANNGGLVKTVAILNALTDPALNGGDNSVVMSLVTDARGTGFPRQKGPAVDVGAFEANNAPTNVSVTPASGASAFGTARTLTAKYSDPDGATDIHIANILVNSSLTANSGLYAYYDATLGLLYLRDDGNANWLGGFAPGSANTISNSQGSLNCAGTTASRSGNVLTVSWSLTPTAAFIGTKNLYLNVADTPGLQAGLQDLGDWLIKSSTNNPPVDVSLTPVSAVSTGGTPQNFTAQYSDADGALDIRTACLLVNPTVTGNAALYVYYDVILNQLFLRDDANSTWLGGFAPGSANVISNGQGSLNCAATTVTRSGNNLTVKWNLTPNFAYVGTKNLYLRVIDSDFAADGFEDMGDWLIKGDSNAAPTNVSVSPAAATSAAAAAKSFTAVYSDADGALDIRYAYFLVNGAVSGAHGLYAYYDTLTGLLYLRDDTSTTWVGGFAPGSAHTISNSQGTLNCAAITVSHSGNNLTVVWNLTPTVAFAGARNLYLYVVDTTNAHDSFDDLGDWTITASAAPLGASPDPSGTRPPSAGTS